MKWVFVIVIDAVAVELFLLLPVIGVSTSILETGRKSAHVISSRLISDRWKEKAMQLYAKVMLLQVSRLALYFSFIALCLYSVLFLADTFVPGFSTYMISVRGMLVATLIATLYFMLRKRLVPQ